MQRLHHTGVAQLIVLRRCVGAQLANSVHAAHRRSRKGTPLLAPACCRGDTRGAFRERSEERSPHKTWGIQVSRGQSTTRAGVIAGEVAGASDATMYVLGLTGSIGMGKSTVSGMFTQKGIPVMDSDAVVHRLYAPGGAAVRPVREAFPDAVIDGGINRTALSKYVVGNEAAMKQLEEIVHPLVEEERINFLRGSKRDGRRLVVLDMPLLFETKAECKVDAVAVVSAGAEAQRQRVLDRPGMTEEKFNHILSRQVPDEEKRSRADYVIDTSTSLEQTEAEVDSLINKLADLSCRVAGSLDS
uniref:Dephospho-CoA kinase n=2 Tax=Tetraselmis chuii TaxID=63592 RepID=A0A7S1SME3_9CHLO|mmetsp:Transcript_18506/g.32962  ORF Transcript_18506/g.32962 Transcript_18506/m.32962 type:complete len:301 (+) Transcript_18506:116-1018(+)|eukprot:CAMPEP_0177762148 /NCGR_PEP_ID=MMETSP0491_2-20121128/6187_1 /TAXON_ID=63592 /ORGANISM="Tetraselmis chuii, Strain PLY429" /LENGTH=300 /DNA_ID=CAMNT_0019278177 /DNA_START=78 /DNA_END=980 /DNA_ORIENTATION=+